MSKAPKILQDLKWAKCFNMRGPQEREKSVKNPSNAGQMRMEKKLKWNLH